ncbi:MAG: metallophosphoesterase [Planctomycetes bacterium]|nr:metallophosphoesterase [Planctomycetota bacterium]
MNRRTRASRIAPILIVITWFAGIVRAQDDAHQDQDRHVHTSRKDARILPLPREDGVFHFVIYGDRTGGPAEGIRVLEQAVRDTNLLDPDLVMTVGDLVQGYNAHDAWIEQMNEFRGVMDGLRCAWFPVAGNHDIYWRGPKRPEFEHERDYETHFGPLWYRFTHKNSAFFVLYTDEGDPKDGTRGIREARHQQMSAAQLAWLKSELAAVRDKKHVFVFCHHPRWIESRYPGSNWSEVHAILKSAGNVTAVFGGHIHRIVYSGKKDGIEYHALATTGGHLSEENAPDLGFVHHLDVVTVRDEGIQVATIPVGAVIDPTKLTEERLRELDMLRGAAIATASEPIVIATDGSALGVASMVVSNPTSFPALITVTPFQVGQQWSFGPDHVHATIEPGKERRISFAVSRLALGFDRFEVPEFSVETEWLSDAGRVGLPGKRMRLGVVLDAAEDRPFDASRSGSLSIRGDASCVILDSARLAVPDGPFTIECWVQPRELEGRRGLLGQAEQSEFGLFVSDGTIDFAVHLDGSYRSAKTGEPLLRTGVWQHVAGVFDGHEVRVYLDGNLVARTRGSGRRTRNTLPFIIGGDTGKAGPNSGVVGSIDEVRVSSVARYTALSFEPSRRFAPDEATLALLHFDEAFGPFIADTSGRKNHGVLRDGAEIDRSRSVLSR